MKDYSEENTTEYEKLETLAEKEIKDLSVKYGGKKETSEDSFDEASGSESDSEGAAEDTAPGKEAVNDASEKASGTRGKKAKKEVKKSDKKQGTAVESDILKEQRKSGNKRMTSIARMINWDFWFKNLFGMILLDVILFSAMIAWFFIKCNMSMPDTAFQKSWANMEYAPETDVEVIWPEDDEDTIIYKVTTPDGDVYEFDAGEYLSDWGAIMAIFLAGQLTWLILQMFNTRRVRRRMKPLYDVALKAEAVSRMSSRMAEKDYMSDETMQHLESAINRADPNEPLIATGDKELQGIEIALNNLLNEMQESKKQQIRFVSDASHELRTPIAVIQGYVNMLDRWGKEDEEVLTESIEALKNESEHMKELVEQLLFLARGDSGRNNLQRKDFSLAEVLYEVWEESCMIDEGHKYTFYLDGKETESLDDTAAEESGPEPEYIENIDFDNDGKEAGDESQRYVMNGDIAMIKQSARIFFQNAAKYSEKGSEIMIKVNSGRGGKVSYVIQDEGIGLNQEQLGHIFERFYRSDQARNADTGGTGLGLSIAKWIIDAHDGTIDVLSRTEFGTRFTVNFNNKISERMKEANG